MTSEPPMRDPGALARYYLMNAEDLLARGCHEMAAGLFWGAVAAAVRAVAFRSGRDLTTHQALRMFARQVAKDLQDEILWLRFKSAETLHAHFYRPDRDPAEVEEAAHDARAVVESLLQVARHWTRGRRPRPPSPPSGGIDTAGWDEADDFPVGGEKLIH